jgi:hypothetical protein
MLKRRLLIIAAVVVLVVIGGVLWWGPSNLIGRYTHGAQVRDGDLEPGDAAPSVTVVALETTAAGPISDWFGIRPVVLVFGSYTSPVFRQAVPRLETLAEQFQDRAQFLAVYIREAHAEGEWQVAANRQQGIVYRQPETLDERLRIAGDFVDHFGFSLPVAVDGPDDLAEAAYAAWPERIYVVDESGGIVYKSEPGADGFNLSELSRWLEASLPQILDPSDVPDAVSGPDTGPAPI